MVVEKFHGLVGHSPGTNRLDFEVKSSKSFFANNCSKSQPNCGSDVTTIEPIAVGNANGAGFLKQASNKSRN